MEHQLATLNINTKGSLQSFIQVKEILPYRAMAASFFPPLLVLLCFSQLICFNAVPISRTTSLMQESRDHQVSLKAHLGNAEKLFGVETIIRRMNVELNDYPGSGANNRHTPKPPGRTCADC